MNLIGKPSIHPILFYTGKILGYITWCVLLYELLNMPCDQLINLEIIKLIALIVLFIGMFFSIVSIINLGRSTRFGLPEENTVFKQKGLYRFSRNPMYLGFDLLTLSAILFTWNGYILLMGIYSILIYHFIILAEEKFMENRFGNEYASYKKNTVRYLFLK